MAAVDKVSAALVHHVQDVEDCKDLPSEELSPAHAAAGGMAGAMAV